MVQQLSPLLGLNSTSLNLTETEYNQLMSRPTFVIADPTIDVFNDTEPTSCRGGGGGNH